MARPAAEGFVAGHASYRAAATGGRLRRNYLWIFTVQGLAYFGKILIHPAPPVDRGEAIARMGIGALPGWMMLVIVAGIYGAIGAFTLKIYLLDREKFKRQPNPISMG